MTEAMQVDNVPQTQDTINATSFVSSLVGSDGRPLIIDIREDGYVNLTQICKSAKKELGGYLRKERTAEFLLELSRDIKKPVGIDISKTLLDNQDASMQNCMDAESNISSSDRGLVQKMANAPIHCRDTWGHRRVAINLANWCSPKFEVAVANLIDRYLMGQLTTEESKAAHREMQQRLQWHLMPVEPIVSGEPVVYVVQIMEHGFPQLHRHGTNGDELPRDTPLVKIGSSSDVGKRAFDDKRYPNFMLLGAVRCCNPRAAEQALLKEYKSAGMRVTGSGLGPKDTELIAFDGTQAGYEAIAKKVSMTAQGMAYSEELQILREKNESYRLLQHMDHDGILKQFEAYIYVLENASKCWGQTAELTNEALNFMRSYTSKDEKIKANALDDAYAKRLEAERSYNLQMEAARDKERSHELQMANIKLQMMHMERDRAH
ncbi:hypothetical protein WJX84_000753 [Apatococcus fuscideae]|uniref:KilA-N domain-containing protein n=1 Tax=Apatococcus fuscideae TaxID=2026836 RepID=A0AAW1T7F4_9CHLO